MLVKSNLTVFFEDPFWVCVYERQSGSFYEAAKKLPSAQSRKITRFMISL